MTVTPTDIAATLGRPTPDDITAAQWTLWISDATRAIQRRAAQLGVDFAGLDVNDVDYVVRETVAAKVKNPDAATSVEVAVDDARTVRRFERTTGQVTIPDAFWDLLGLSDGAGTGAFTVTPSFTPDATWPGWPA